MVVGLPCPTVDALIYTRVSEDRAHGRSVAEQEADARAVCDRNGWHVTEVVTDTVGASRHSKGQRPGWEQVRQRLEAGTVDVLVTWEASRAQRDLEAYAELRDLCRRTGTRWSYSGRTHDMDNVADRFATGLDALLAEREADEISHRVRRAIRANAVKGSPHGRRLFGYSRTYDVDTGKLTGQIPHPDEADIVRRIFDSYLAGVGMPTIADHLNADKVTTGSGARWSAQQVRRVLRNPAYVAIRVHQDVQVGPANWPALVTEATWERTQARLEARSIAPVPRTARLLTAVARCGVCGAKMAVGRDRGTRKVYQCRGNFCVSRDEANVNEYVTAALLDRLATAEHRTATKPDPALEGERQNLDDLRKRLDEAVDQFAAGKLTGATLARIEAKLLPEIAGAQGRIRQAVVPLGVTLPAGDPHEWWGSLGPEVQREMATALIAAVTILPTGRGVRRFDPDAVVIEWRI